MIDVITYLKLMADRRASDLFLTTGAPPSIKVDGLLHILKAARSAISPGRARTPGAIASTCITSAVKSPWCCA